MRTLVVTQNMTADGSIEMLDTWFEPQGQADMADLQEEMLRQDRSADAMLVGRQTFEDFRGYWRDLTDDATGVSDYLNGVQKYVVSRSLEDPEWQHTTLLTGDPVEEVRKLKDQPGQDIVLTGSITLADAVIEAGLVDEYRFFVYPFVQGRGRRLVGEGVHLGALRLLEARPFESGVVLLRYARAG